MGVGPRVAFRIRHDEHEPDLSALARRARAGLDQNRRGDWTCPSGTIYPILARLEHVGWVDSTWEDPAVHEEAGRPSRPSGRARIQRIGDGCGRFPARKATIAVPNFTEKLAQPHSPA